MNKIILDASSGTLGRIAGFAAKQALLGKEVIVINCNSACITGRKAKTIEEYKTKRKRGGSSMKGPNFPRSPEKIMKRTIRGMLSYKQGRGSNAFKNIKCFNKSSNEYNKKEIIPMKKNLKVKYITLKELSERV